MRVIEEEIFRNLEDKDNFCSVIKLFFHRQENVKSICPNQFFDSRTTAC